MNTRLQVEHPVTELVYGVDLVHWQLRIANGERLTFAQEDVRPRGWSIETRIYAEDPANHMLPSTGTITRWDPPEGPGIRVDSGVQTGSEVSVYYDPMLAKLIVYGTDREHAIARLQQALEHFRIDGVRANVPLLLWIARDEWFMEGRTTTSFLAERLDESIFSHKDVPHEAAVLVAASMLANREVPWRIGGVGMPLRLSSDGVTFVAAADATNDPNVFRLNGDLDGEIDVRKLRGAVERNGDAWIARLDSRAYQFERLAPPSAHGGGSGGSGAGSDGGVTAPMPGKIVKIAVREGDQVAERALLLVLEAMKMEHRIEASLDATVRAVLVKEGDIVAGGAPLVELG